MSQNEPKNKPSLPVSFEFFPPKTPEGAEKLRGVRAALYQRKPEFCSVTYGAGGSTQEGTFNTVKQMLAEGMDAASHFSCIGATRDSVREQLAQLNKQIRAERQKIKLCREIADSAAVMQRDVAAQEKSLHEKETEHSFTNRR